MKKKYVEFECEITPFTVDNILTTASSSFGGGIGDNNTDYEYEIEF